MTVTEESIRLLSQWITDDKRKPIDELKNELPESLGHIAQLINQLLQQSKKTEGKSVYQAQDYERIIRRLTKKLKKAKRIKSCEAELNAFSAKLDRLERIDPDTAVSLRNAITGFYNFVYKYYRSTRKTSGKIDKLKSNLNQSTLVQERLKSRNDELQEAVKKLEISQFNHDEMVQEFEKVKAERDSLSKSLSLMKHKGSAKEEINKLLNRIDEYHDSLKSKNAEIERLKKSIMEKDAIIAKLNQKNSELDNENMNLSKNCKRYIRDEKVLRERFTKERLRTEALSKDLDYYKKKAKGRRGDLQNLDGDSIDREVIEAFAEKMNDVINTIQDVKDKLKVSKENLVLSREEITYTLNNVDINREHTDEINEILEESKKRISDCRKNRKTLEKFTKELLENAKKFNKTTPDDEKNRFIEQVQCVKDDLDQHKIDMEKTKNEVKEARQQIKFIIKKLDTNDYKIVYKSGIIETAYCLNNIKNMVGSSETTIDDVMALLETKIISLQQNIVSIINPDTLEDSSSILVLAEGNQTHINNEETEDINRLKEVLRRAQQQVEMLENKNANLQNQLANASLVAKDDSNDDSNDEFSSSAQHNHKVEDLSGFEINESALSSILKNDDSDDYSEMTETDTKSKMKNSGKSQRKAKGDMKHDGTLFIGPISASNKESNANTSDIFDDLDLESMHSHSAIFDKTANLEWDLKFEALTKEKDQIIEELTRERDQKIEELTKEKDRKIDLLSRESEAVKVKLGLSPDEESQLVMHKLDDLLSRSELLAETEENIKKINNELKQKGDKLSETTKLLEDLKTQLASRDEEMKEIKVGSQKRSDTERELESQLDVVRTELSNIRKRLNDAHNVVETAKESITVNDNQLRETRSALMRKEESFGSTMKNLSDVGVELRNSSNELKSHRSSLSITRKRLKQACKNIEALGDVSQGELDESVSQNELETIRSTVQQLHAQLITTQQQLDDASEESAKNYQLHDQNTKLFSNVRDNLVNLQTNLRDARRDLCDAKDDVADAILDSFVTTKDLSGTINNQDESDIIHSFEDSVDHYHKLKLSVCDDRQFDLCDLNDLHVDNIGFEDDRSSDGDDLKKDGPPKKLSDAYAVIDEIRSDIEQSSNEIAHFRESSLKQQEDLKNTQKRLSETGDAVERDESDLQKVIEEIQLARMDVSRNKESIEKIKDEFTPRGREFSQIAKELTEAKLELRNVKVRLDKTTDVLRKTRTAYDTSIDELSSTKDLLKVLEDELTTANTKLKLANSDLNSVREELDAENPKFTEAIGHLSESSIVTITEDVIPNAVSPFRLRASTFDTIITRISESNTSTEESGFAVNSVRESLGSRANHLQEVIDSFTLTKNSLDFILSNQVLDKQCTNDVNQGCTEELPSYDSDKEHNGAKEYVLKIQDDINNLREHLSKYQSEILHKDSEFNRVVRILKKTERDLSSNMLNLKQVQDSLQNTQKELHDTREELDQKNEALDEARAGMLKTSKELTETKSLLNEANNKLETTRDSLNYRIVELTKSKEDLDREFLKTKGELEVSNSSNKSLSEQLEMIKHDLAQAKLYIENQKQTEDSITEARNELVNYKIQLDNRYIEMNQQAKDLEETRAKLQRSQEELNEVLNQLEITKKELNEERESSSRNIAEAADVKMKMTSAEEDLRELREKLMSETKLSDETRSELARIQSELTLIKNELGCKENDLGEARRQLEESYFNLDRCKLECAQALSDLQKEKELQSQTRSKLELSKLKKNQLKETIQKLEQDIIGYKIDMVKKERELNDSNLEKAGLLEAKEKVVTLTLSLEEAKIDLLRVQTDLEQKQLELIDTKDQLSLVNDELAQAKEELEAAIKELQVSKASLEEANNELAEKDKILHEHKLNLERTQEALENAKADLAETKELLDLTKVDSKEADERLNEALNKMNQELTKTRALLNQVTEQLNTKNNELKKVTCELDSAKGELSTAKEDLDNTKSKLDNTSNDLSKVRIELDEARDSLDKNQVELSNVMQELDSCKVELDASKQMLDTKTKELIDSNKELGEVQKLLIEARKELTANRHFIDDANIKLDVSNKELEKTKDDFMSKHSELEQTKSLLDQRTTDLKSSQETLGLVMLEVDDLREKLRAAVDERTRYHDELIETRKSFSDAELDLQKRYNDIETLKAELRNTREKNEMALNIKEKQLNEARALLEDAQNKIKSVTDSLNLRSGNTLFSIDEVLQRISELEDTRLQLNAYKCDLQVAREQLSSTSEELKNTKEALKESRSSFDDILLTLNVTREELQNARAEVISSNDAHSETKVELTSTIERLKVMSDSATELRCRVNDLQNELLELKDNESKLVRAEHEIKAVTESLQHKESELLGTQESLRSTRLKLRKALTVLKSEVANRKASEHELAATRQRLAEIQGNLESLQSVLMITRGELQNAKDLVSTTTNDIDAVMVELDSALSRFDVRGARTHLKQMKSYVQGLKGLPAGTHDDLIGTRASNQSDVSESMGMDSIQIASISPKQVALSFATSSIYESSISHVDKARIEITEINEMIRLANDGKREILDELLNKKEELEAVRRTLSVSESRLEEVTMLYESTSTDLVAANKSLENAMLELHITNEQLQIVRQENLAEKALHAKTQSELADVSAELSVQLANLQDAMNLISSIREELSTIRSNFDDETISHQLTKSRLLELQNDLAAREDQLETTTSELNETRTRLDATNVSLEQTLKELNLVIAELHETKADLEISKNDKPCRDEPIANDPQVLLSKLARLNSEIGELKERLSEELAKSDSLILQLDQQSKVLEETQTFNRIRDEQIGYLKDTIVQTQSKLPPDQVIDIQELEEHLSTNIPRLVVNDPHYNLPTQADRLNYLLRELCSTRADRDTYKRKLDVLKESLTSAREEVQLSSSYIDSLHKQLSTSNPSIIPITEELASTKERLSLAQNELNDLKMHLADVDGGLSDLKLVSEVRELKFLLGQSQQDNLHMLQQVKQMQDIIRAKDSPNLTDEMTISRLNDILIETQNDKETLAREIDLAYREIDATKALYIKHLSQVTGIPEEDIVLPEIPRFAPSDFEFSEIHSGRPAGFDRESQSRVESLLELAHLPVLDFTDNTLKETREKLEIISKELVSANDLINQGKVDSNGREHELQLTRMQLELYRHNLDCITDDLNHKKMELDSTLKTLATVNSNLDVLPQHFAVSKSMEDSTQDVSSLTSEELKKTQEEFRLNEELISHSNHCISKYNGIFTGLNATKELLDLSEQEMKRIGDEMGGELMNHEITVEGLDTYKERTCRVRENLLQAEDQINLTSEGIASTLDAIHETGQSLSQTLTSLNQSIASLDRHQRICKGDPVAGMMSTLSGNKQEKKSADDSLRHAVSMVYSMRSDIEAIQTQIDDIEGALVEANPESKDKQRRSKDVCGKLTEAEKQQKIILHDAEMDANGMSSKYNKNNDTISTAYNNLLQLVKSDDVVKSDLSDLYATLCSELQGNEILKSDLHDAQVLVQTIDDSLNYIVSELGISEDQMVIMTPVSEYAPKRCLQVIDLGSIDTRDDVKEYIRSVLSAMSFVESRIGRLTEDRSAINNISVSLDSLKERLDKDLTQKDILEMGNELKSLKVSLMSVRSDLDDMKMDLKASDDLIKDQVSVLEFVLNSLSPRATNEEEDNLEVFRLRQMMSRSEEDRAEVVDELTRVQMEMDQNDNDVEVLSNYKEAAQNELNKPDSSGDPIQTEIYRSTKEHDNVKTRLNKIARGEVNNEEVVKAVPIVTYDTVATNMMSDSYLNVSSGRNVPSYSDKSYNTSHSDIPTHEVRLPSVSHSSIPVHMIPASSSRSPDNCSSDTPVLCNKSTNTSQFGVPVFRNLPASMSFDDAHPGQTPIILEHLDESLPQDVQIRELRYLLEEAERDRNDAEARNADLFATLQDTKNKLAAQVELVEYTKSISLNPNPDIAQMQRELIDKQSELLETKNSLNGTKNFLIETENKLRNVQEQMRLLNRKSYLKQSVLSPGESTALPAHDIVADSIGNELHDPSEANDVLRESERRVNDARNELLAANNKLLLTQNELSRTQEELRDAQNELSVVKGRLRETEKELDTVQVLLNEAHGEADPLKDSSAVPNYRLGESSHHLPRDPRLRRSDRQTRTLEENEPRYVNEDFKRESNLLRQQNTILDDKLNELHHIYGNPDLDRITIKILRRALRNKQLQLAAMRSDDNMRKLINEMDDLYTKNLELEAECQRLKYSIQGSHKDIHDQSHTQMDTTSLKSARNTIKKLEKALINADQQVKRNKELYDKTTRELNAARAKSKMLQNQVDDNYHANTSKDIKISMLEKEVKNLKLQLRDSGKSYKKSYYSNQRRDGGFDALPYNIGHKNNDRVPEAVSPMLNKYEIEPHLGTYYHDGVIDISPLPQNSIPRSQVSVHASPRQPNSGKQGTVVTPILVKAPEASTSSTESCNDVSPSTSLKLMELLDLEYVDEKNIIDKVTQMKTEQEQLLSKIKSYRDTLKQIKGHVSRNKDNPDQCVNKLLSLFSRK